MESSQFYNPERDEIYSLLAKYFGNPEITKMKDVENYSMYICKIYAVLGIEFRYIIAFVLKDEFPVGNKTSLFDLPWISLQTRTLTDDHVLYQHTYIPSKFGKINSKIRLIMQDEKQYKYSVDNLPIFITLLPKQKTRNWERMNENNASLEYSREGSLMGALETYQTIITFE